MPVISVRRYGAPEIRRMGIPQDLLGRAPFNTDDHIRTWKSVPEDKDRPTKTFQKRGQQELVQRLLAEPFSGRYTVVISSFPNDGKARCLAACVLAEAYKKHLQGLAPTAALRRDPPVWHSVYGGLKDKYRDAEEPYNPSLIVLANINTETTAHKMEKARDLLDMYSAVPRILVVAAKDPRQFVDNRLMFEANGLVQLWTSKVIDL